MKWTKISVLLYFCNGMKHGNRFFFVLLFLCSATMAGAQTRFMVMDMEVYEPVADVTVYTDRRDVYHSDKQGRVVIDRPFSSLTLSHKNYVHRTLRKSELRDTIRLLPKSVTINEVVITAKRPTASQQIFKSVKDEAMQYGTAPSGRDFLKFLQRNKVRRKIREKARKAVEDY